MAGMDPLIETIKSIILDFQEAKLETGVPRRLRIETVRGKAAVCIGVRRSESAAAAVTNGTVPVAHAAA